MACEHELKRARWSSTAARSGRAYAPRAKARRLDVNRLRPDRVTNLRDRVLDGGAKARKGDGQQRAHDDHGEDQRVLDEGLTIVAFESTDEHGRPGSEAIDHEFLLPIPCE